MSMARCILSRLLPAVSMLVQAVVMRIAEQHSAISEFVAVMYRCCGGGGAWTASIAERKRYRTKGRYSPPREQSQSFKR